MITAKEANKLAKVCYKDKKYRILYKKFVATVQDKIIDSCLVGECSYIYAIDGENKVYVAENISEMLRNIGYKTKILLGKSNTVSLHIDWSE